MMIFWFRLKNLKTQAVAVAFSIAWLAGEVEPQPEDARARGRLAAFRGELYRCFTARADALFELADAVLCADGPVKTLVGLSLAPEHQRGHGALYDAVNCGRVEIARLRRALAGLPLPRWGDGRIRLGVDVSPWLRPAAATSAERLFCHVYGRGKGQAQMIPGWPYSVVAALEPGRTSWTAVLDAVRLGPGDDETAVTAAQVRDVVARLIEAGHWRQGDPAILVVFDAGYDIARLGYLLAGLPVEVLGRLRSSRVLCLPPPPRRAGAGRPARHGAEFKLADEASWPAPAVTTSTQTARYGTAVATAWDRLHPRLTHRAAWEDHSDGELPILEGTLIRLQVDHLPGDRDPKPVWLWHSATGATPADRWTWLIIACHTQLRLARDLAADLRRPWESPPRRAGSPPPGYGGDSGTSTPRPPIPPVRQNPANPAPDGHPAPGTTARQHATTWERTRARTQPTRATRRNQVKRQAKGLEMNDTLNRAWRAG